MLQPSQLQDASVRFAREIAEVRAFLRSATVEVETDRAVHAVVQRLATDTGFRRDLTSHVWLLLDRKGTGASDVLAVLVMAAAGTECGREVDGADAHALLRFILQTRQAFEQIGPQELLAAAAPVLHRPLRVPGTLGRRNVRYAAVAAAVLVVLLSLTWWIVRRQARPITNVAVRTTANSSNDAARQTSANSVHPAASSPAPPPAAQTSRPQRAPELAAAGASPRIVPTGTRPSEVRPPAQIFTAPSLTKAAPEVVTSLTVKNAIPVVPSLGRDSTSSIHNAAPIVSRNKAAVPAGQAAVPAPQLSKLLDSPKLPAYASDPEFTAEGKRYPRLLRRHPSSFTDAGSQSEQVALLHTPGFLSGMASGRAVSPGVVPSGVVRPGCLGMMAGNLEYSPAPAYPQAAAVAHVQGEVRIQATVDRDGSVTSARVISGPPLLREAALDAVQRWRYRPYSAAGKPVPAGTTAVLDFQLE